MEKNKATIKLFKALLVESKDKVSTSRVVNYFQKTFKKGFVFDNCVLAEYTDLQLAEIINLVEEEHGMSAEQMNSSFHKSWDKVRNTSIEKLVVEQIIHYITTYGYESLGIYNENAVYIPHEKLEIPELKEDIKLNVIKGYTRSELKQKMFRLIGSGIALKEQTKKDLITVAKFVGMNVEDIEKVKNKEVKCELYNILGLVPKDPKEFLRYLIYSNNGSTLIIKNKELINKIKNNVSSKDTILIEKYIYENDKNGEKLSSIFYRYKPLFLVFKKAPSCNTYINKIRKLARENHKPMKEDYLNTITRRIKEGCGNCEPIDNDKLISELYKVNVFRKIRLAYALKFRTTDADSIIYRVRNGKSFVKDFNFKNKNYAKNILNIVLDSIVKDVRNNVGNKKVFLPKDMIYTLPSTEKQFTGNIPTGSYVELDSDMIVGIHWNNLPKYRVDLDLSMQNSGVKFGWDGAYRDYNRDLLFSGDITDARGKKGATELYYIAKRTNEALIMSVNYYNFNEKKPVPYKIIVAKEDPKGRFSPNYMVDQNNLVGVAKSTIDKKQSIIGLVVPNENGNRFYFTETGIGNSITSGMGEYMNQARKFLINNYENSIKLRNVLEMAGIEFVDTPEEADIDLSYENLEKDTIINLLVKDEN